MLKRRVYRIYFVVGVAVLVGLIALLSTRADLLPFVPSFRNISFQNISLSGRVRPPLSRTPASSPPAVGLAVGNRAPDFTLKALDGRDISLARYRGRPLILNFWMVHCDGCQLETSALQEIQRNPAYKDVAVVSVNVIDGSESVRQFVQHYGLTYPVACDTQATLSALYRLRGTPTTFLLDRQGTIRARTEGALDEGTLEQQLRSVDADME